MTTALSDARSDFPLPPTALIGRERERTAIRATLAEEGVRLVTLTGPGGIGKTRLALDAAAHLDPAIADGAMLVSLAAVRDPVLVLPTIAQAIGVREGTGQATRAAIEEALRDRRLLLILDNLEHLTDAIPDIAWLLGACPGLRILVTSRSRLQLRGEHEFAVFPLPLPDPDQTTDTSNPAVALFVARARAIDPAFGPSAGKLPAIAQV
jgi:predicted ATPase